jgi:hypothetical protein
MAGFNSNDHCASITWTIENGQMGYGQMGWGGGGGLGIGLTLDNGHHIREQFFLFLRQNAKSRIQSS